MDNSLVKQLYDFLLENQLVTPNISEVESLELLENAINTLDEDENILTGFIVDEGDEQSKAYIFSNRSELKTNTGDIILADSINSIENSSDTEVSIKTTGGELVINGVTPDRANAISDALFTALSEVYPQDRVNDIFSLEPDDVIVDEEEFDKLPEESSETIELDEIPENEIIPQNNYLDTTPSDTDLDNIDFKSSETPVLITNVDKEEPEILDKKKVNFNKPLMYILGAVFIVIIGVVAYFAVTSIMSSNASNQKAEELVNYLNRIDAVYYQAEEYVNAGIGGSTVDNWSQLNTEAVAIQEEMYNFEPTEKIDDLYQSVYFYNDALITALYYGQSAASSGNQGQLEICKQRLENAYQNRLAALEFLDENYPNLYENLEHATDLDEEDLGYNSDEVEQLINEANSKPSNEASENSKSSNEARENSIRSD